MKKALLFLVILSATMVVAKDVTPAKDIPTYYAAVNGTSGASLFSTLTTITNQGFSTLGYDGLYGAYPKTDYTSNGELWDMYSDCGTTKQCGNYGKECDCYNREHSIPQSWWGGGTGSIGCDIFHVIPTDGYVNNRRGNESYGEVNSATYTSKNGSKLGKSVSSIPVGNKTICSAAGATVSTPGGTVFEPINEYKGDLARGYLGVIMKWNTSKTLTKAEGDKVFQSSYTANTNWGLTTYGVALLLKWHRQDPVSQKEIDRNNGIQKTQGNRNPFIDYPYLVEYIWGEHAGEKVDMSMLLSSSAPDFIPGVSSGLIESTEPSMKSSETELKFATTMQGQSANLTTKLTALRMTDAISCTITGNDAAQFSVTPTSIAAAKATGTHTIMVTYAPKAQAKHTATLKIASEGATTLTIPLSGACASTCEIEWLVDGEETTAGDPTTQVAAGGAITTLPTAPKSCSVISNQFAGWSEYMINDSTDDVPVDLFSDVEEAPVIQGNTTFHAVFAKLTEVKSETPSELVWNNPSTTGWTVSKTKSTSDYQVLQTDASITSPAVDLSGLLSITIKMRTYGGDSYKTVKITANGQTIGSLSATSNSLADQTWTNTSSLTGTYPLVFSSSTCGSNQGPGVAVITITSKGTTYKYTRFITSCSMPMGMENVNDNDNHNHNGRKVMRDGRLMIEVNGVRYNVLGVKVN